MLLAFLLAGCSGPSVEVAAPRAPSTAGLIRGPTGTPDWTVDCNGSGDFTTLSDAVAAATERQWIEVLPCTYTERLDYGGKALWISSRDGSATTALQGQGLTVDQGEGFGTAFVGFTVRGASSQAIDLDLASLYLRDVVFSSNAGVSVVRSLSGDLRMEDVTIDSSNSPWGAAVFADKGAVVLARSTVVCGTGPAVQADHGSFLVDGSTLDCTGPGPDPAFETEHGVGRLQRSTVLGDVVVEAEDDHPDDVVRLDNTLVRGDIDIHWGTVALRNALVTGTLTLTETGGTELVESTLFVGPVPCGIAGDTPPATVRYNDFFGPTEAACFGSNIVGIDGNISVDPLFVNAPAGDLHLAAGSPVIDAGSPDVAMQDVDGTRNDMGLYGGRFSQDGGW